jgi:hypothetical protein
MTTLVVVEGDKVEGVDRHSVSGDATNPSGTPPTIPYAGVAEFEYVGAVTDALSDFVSIDDTPVALVSSKSSLNMGENIPPAGKHSGPQGSNFIPPAPAPIPITLSIDDSVGEGTPSMASGSSFVSIGGDAVLLDGDSIDTCDGLSIPMNSSVSAENQDFVSCSE